MKKLKWIFGILFILAAMIGCEKDSGVDDPTFKNLPYAVVDKSALPDGGTLKSTAPTENYVSEVFPLTAGQTIPVGTVTVYNTVDNLWVVYDVTVTDELGAVHISFGSTAFDVRIPPGQGDIVIDETTGQSVVIQIALADLGLDVCVGGVLYIQAHAEVGIETAFGGDIPTTSEGIPLPNGSWFGNIMYTILANVPVSIVTEVGSLDAIVGCLDTEEGLVAYEEAMLLEPEFLIDENYGLESLNFTFAKIAVYTEEGIVPPVLLFSTVTKIWTATDVCGNIATFEQAITILPCGTTIIEDPEVPTDPCYQDETAFAFGNECFIDNGFKRWGWTNELEEGDTEIYDVYAGAGQCDTDKGLLVGTVTVSYFDGDVEFDWVIDEEYTLLETHEYAGTDMFPTLKKGKETVAPGAYTNEGGFGGDAVYVIAHAVVGFEVECPPDLP